MRTTTELSYKTAMSKEPQELTENLESLGLIPKNKNPESKTKVLHKNWEERTLDATPLDKPTGEALKI